MGFRFREWPVYNDARKYRLDIEKEVICKIPGDERFELISQLRRALISVILNVAEGSFRSTDKDLSHFLNQAITSVYEVVACLDIAFDNKYINKEIHLKYLNESEKLVKQLQAFRRHLLNTH